MGYNKKNEADQDNIDALIFDVKNMLEEDATQSGRSETPQSSQVRDEARYASIVRGAAAQADRAVRGYTEKATHLETEREAAYYDETPKAQTSGANAGASFVAYNSDFSAEREKTAGASRRRADSARQVSQKTARWDPDALRSDAADRTDTDRAAPRPKKRRRGLGCLPTLLLILVLLVGALYGALRLFGGVAKKDALRERKSGVSTVLIAGTDDGGLRTDTMMLVTIDEKNKVYNVLSLPRDTLTNAPYSVPKLNGAYGYYGCGEEGMQALLDLVEQCIGFRPDGYVLIDWNGFEELVDVMGGIDFEVPMDMELDGVTLSAGVQHLDGRGALTVARFRAGYSLADLQRIQVQRNLIQAALDQWLTIPNLLKVPSAIRCVQENTLTDLNVLNILWLARDLKTCKSGVNETLPGTAQMIGDGSYYVLDAQAVAEMMNEYFNPYVADITTADLKIREG